MKETRFFLREVSIYATAKPHLKSKTTTKTVQKICGLEVYPKSPESSSIDKLWMLRQSNSREIKPSRTS
jgi:hypothetical protein